MENKIIVKMLFGSHLYGTATKDSDKDYKGIFLPSKEEIFLGKIPKSIQLNTKKDNQTKNSSDDIDTELYSLHYFIELACKGETAALDMLHAPENMIIEKSYIWDKIISNRHLFYTKNLNAFVGYARKQAAKYGIKGTRLNDAKRVIDFCSSILTTEEDQKLFYYWERLPGGEHIFKLPSDITGQRFYQVCGKKIGEKCTISYLKDIIEKFYNSYGHRAELAAKNEGIDWKAVSHALRAAYQVREILTNKTITFPLKDADYLIKVKQGELDYQTEVSPKLELMMEEIEKLSLKSDLPEKINRKYWDEFIIKTIGENL